MKIGLLACDHIQKEFPDYPELFRSVIPKHPFKIYNVCDGVFPKSASECEAWIITGSKYSVYDEIDWIIQLKRFVREIAAANKYCIGVCFGHQMLGEAMGGKVQKSKMGWCVGVHEFDILGKEGWMIPYQSKVNLLMSCQDQITVLPPNSVVLAQSQFCPVGMIKIGEKMLGIQGHPEFSKDYVKSLMEDRENRMGVKVVRLGIESLESAIHSNIVSKWMSNFLDQSNNSIF